MSKPDHFSDATLQFLADLKQNNSRDWFTQNKTTYETEVKLPAKQFAASMCQALSDLTGQVHHDKIYRIHRDVRFSKDKTPYNAHVHISFAPSDAAAGTPMWFFGLTSESLSFGCGVFQFDKATLPQFRDAVAGAKGTGLMDLARQLSDGGIRVSEPDLKRVPAGYDKDHPNADSLRRKGFSAWIDLKDARTAVDPDVVQVTLGHMRRLLPVFEFLSSIVR